MKGKLTHLEEQLRLPRRKTGEALARQVSAEMVTWSQLQREIDERQVLLQEDGAPLMYIDEETEPPW